MSFWASYVLLKEKQGVEREIILNLIEEKLGLEVRQGVEDELNVSDEATDIQLTTHGEMTYD